MIARQIRWSDAQAMAWQYPDTFQAPTKKMLDKIRSGDAVMVSANDQERFWLLVEKVEGDEIVGTVNNHLVMVPLRFGERVTVEKRNVYNVSKPKK